MKSSASKYDVSVASQPVGDAHQKPDPPPPYASHDFARQSSHPDTLRQPYVSPRPPSRDLSRASDDGYAPLEGMSTEALKGDTEGACCSRNGACCFSDHGACCFSDHGACCVSDNGACCFSDNGACCFSDHGGCCFSDHGGCCFSDKGGCCFSNLK
ncbi:hypothetical protein F4821DRAFT_114165 [Hypoxylon rubiginosum]|uniref:Uncharacterized protein n=1 Tax=Hypoxylon rubiginosum TaxID=110542 RepID=A0ACC0DJH4_9PEZI|nr:hypothetical protein F4821DRAFT_114165 [Hypoxylon rubiginosum]